MKGKKLQHLHFTYSEYIQFLEKEGKSHKFKSNNFYLKKYSFIKNILHSIPCCIYILNYESQKFLFFSDYCKYILGYTSEELLRNGLPWSMSRVQPDDFAIFSTKIFPGF